MPAFTREQVEAALQTKSAELMDADFARIAEAGAAVKQLIRELPRELEKTRDQAWVLFEIVKSYSHKKDMSLEGTRAAAAALIYLGSPMDLVPDDESEGFEDDAAVVALAIEKAEADVRKFCEADRRDPTRYL